MYPCRNVDDHIQMVDISEIFSHQNEGSIANYLNIEQVNEWPQIARQLRDIVLTKYPAY